MTNSQFEIMFHQELRAYVLERIILRIFLFSKSVLNFIDETYRRGDRLSGYLADGVNEC